MNIKTRILALPLLLAAALAHGAAPVADAVTDALKAGAFAPPRAAPPLALASTTGKPFDLAAYRGKVVILEFGYTHCAAVCPVTLAQLAEARRLLGADAAKVQVLFVTVDPGRDDAARLREYLAHFDHSFIGLTGTAAQVGAAMAGYGITARKIPMAGGEYGVDHSAYIYFIDRKGMLRALMPFGRPAADVAHDARVLLREGAR